MATKKDIAQFQKLIESIENEFDEFFDEKLGDIEIYLEQNDLRGYSFVNKIFDNIENYKNSILYELNHLKKILSRILQSV